MMRELGEETGEERLSESRRLTNDLWTQDP